MPLWTDDALSMCGRPRRGMELLPIAVGAHLHLLRGAAHVPQARRCLAALATTPWGPWSAPTTIFNPSRDDGYCHFIHYLHCPPGSPNPYNHTAKGASQNGSDYGAHVIPGWTTSTRLPGGDGVASTFYWVMDTFDPYGEVIMSTTLSEKPRAKVAARPAHPGRRPRLTTVTSVKRLLLDSDTM